ncbi:MAG: DUF1588 domain-containing protein [Bradymonadia bacterium]
MRMQRHHFTNVMAVFFCILTLGCHGESANTVGDGFSAGQDMTAFDVNTADRSSMDAEQWSDSGLVSDGGITESDAETAGPDGALPMPDAGGSPPMAPNPNTLSQASLFSCNGAPGSSPARIRRLNRLEWLRSIGQSIDSPAARNPLDPDDSLHYPTYSKGVSLDAATVDQFLDVNYLPGGSWTARYGNPRLDLVIASSQTLNCFQNPCSEMTCDAGSTCINGRCREGGCDELGCPNSHSCIDGTCTFDRDRLPSAECIEQFVEFLLERGVYFRPATESEITQMVTFAEAQLANEGPDGQSRNQTITKMVQAAWMSTGALFRTEVGGEPDDTGRRHLTDVEYGLALSYALSDRVSGAPTYVWPFSHPEGWLPEIRAAVEAGQISDPDVVDNLVRLYAGGHDPGDLPADADPDEIPAEIEALDTPETRGAYARAMAEYGGRLDLRQDFGAPRRSRRGEFYLSDKLRDFFRSWLGYAEAEVVFKDRPEATSRFDDGSTSVYRPLLSAWNNALGGFYGHEPTLIQLLDDIIARVVIEDRDVLRQLLTTRSFYLPSSTSNPHGGAPVSGNLYDIDTESMPIEDNRAARWTQLPEDQRAGVLTHPAWLAAHGGNFENDPSAVHRGKWIREHLLCGVVPDVPITVDAQLDPETVHLSARARIVEKTEAPECIGCHQLMNPLGYPFEIYNHAGFLRESDHGAAPDGRATLALMPEPELDVEVSDATELMTLLSDSQHVKRCFIRQTFRYFMGRDERVQDACTLAEMESTYDRSGGSMLEMLSYLLRSDTFRYRTVELEGQP